MKRKGIVFLGVAGIILLAALSLFSCERSSVPEKAEKLRVGVVTQPASALVYIAEQQDMFRREGVSTSIQNCQTGPNAVEDLLAGKVDVATAAEFVLAMHGFKDKNLRAVGTISSSTDAVEIIARKDRGIRKPENLKGKRIGINKGTINEFFLNTFLSFNGILLKEVQIVNLNPLEMVTALSEGKIDAASSFPPYTGAMKKNLAQNAVSWPEQGGQAYYFLLITTEEVIRTRPRAITGLLKGVLEAEAFLARSEKKAKSIVAGRLNLDHESLLDAWSKTHFRVRLDQDLLTLIEDEARWAITNKYVDSTKVPNYFNFLYLEGLEKLRPDAVGVVH